MRPRINLRRLSLTAFAITLLNGCAPKEPPLEDGRVYAILQHDANGICLLEDGRHCLTYDLKTVKVWDLREAYLHEKWKYNNAISLRWESEDKNPHKGFQVRIYENFVLGAYLVTSASSGRLIAAACEPTPERLQPSDDSDPKTSAERSASTSEHVLNIWDTTSGTTRWTVSLPTPVSSLAFSPDSELLAVVLGETELIVYRSDAGREVQRFHRDPDTHTADSEDPVSQPEDRERPATMRLFSPMFDPSNRTVTSRLFLDLKKGDKGPVSFVTWNIDTGTSIIRSQEHRDTVESLAYLADGASLVSADKEKIIKWDIVSGQPVARVPLPSGHRVKAIAPNGDVFTRDQGSVVLWTGLASAQLKQVWAEFKADSNYRMGEADMRTTVGVRDASFSPDGSKIVFLESSFSSGQDSQYHYQSRDAAVAVEVRGARFGDSIFLDRLNRPQETGVLGFSPDGTSIALRARDYVGINTVVKIVLVAFDGKRVQAKWR